MTEVIYHSEGRLEGYVATIVGYAEDLEEVEGAVRAAGRVPVT